MLAVAERHKGTGHIGKCYLSGYGLKKGAIATSISHDNHNLIVAGKNAEDMAVAVSYTHLDVYKRQDLCFLWGLSHKVLYNMSRTANSRPVF